MTGYVDEDRRPLLRVELPDGNRILALIDTGFDGSLSFAENDAIACGVEIDNVYRREVFLAGLRRILVAPGLLTIRWMGRTIEVDVLVDVEDQHRTPTGEPVAVIGTRLLSPSALTVDFGGRTVVIEGT